jgi:RimJ/RimL family protein N-acetyltransferase
MWSRSEALAIGPILASMRVREATLDDCEAMGRAMKIVVDEGRWLATEASSAEELEQRFRYAVETDGNLLFALVEEGELIGALGMHPTHAAGVLSMGMWILPEWRRRGGGRMLVEAAIGARPAEVHKIELEVFPDNAAAIGLYRSLGFEEEGVRRKRIHRRRDGTLRSGLIMARLF